MSDNSILPVPGEPVSPTPPAPPQQYPAQQYPPQQYPAQQYPAQSYPAPSSPAQPPYPAAQYPPQQYPPQQHPAPQPGYPVQQPYPGAAPQGNPYAAYGSPSYPAPRPTSGLAITSLVCAIASVLFSWLLFPILAAVAAVITGHMALKQTKSNTAIGGRGLAFAGLIIGYIMLGVLAIIALMTIISALFLGAFTVPFLVNS